jgi:pyruvate kinase
MLSGETASGRYPIEAVRMMDSIAREVEASDLYQSLSAQALPTYDWDFAGACAAAAAMTSRNTRLAAIVVFSRSGHTANLVAEFRPRAPIVAVTPSLGVAQRLALQWGVIPVMRAAVENAIEVLRETEEVARSVLHAHDGETVAIVVGSQKYAGSKSFILDTLGH